MTLEAIQGATRPSLQLTWADGDGVALNLTGATLTGTIRDSNTGIVRAISGDLVLVTAASGIFRWDYDAEDVADAGRFEVQFEATYVVGQSPARTKRTPWRVHDFNEVTEEA